MGMMESESLTAGRRCVASSGARVVDLFAGAGLLSYAFQREGFDIAVAVEHDRHAVETYQSNLGDHVIHRDIRDVAPVGACDVLVGGPPCQGFSTLGKRDPHDLRNELALEFVRWADKLRPLVVVVENVEPFARRWVSFRPSSERHPRRVASESRCGPCVRESAVD